MAIDKANGAVAELKATLAALRTTKAELERTKAELEKTLRELADAKEDLEKTKAELKKKTNELEDAKTTIYTLEQRADELEEGKAAAEKKAADERAGRMKAQFVGASMRAMKDKHRDDAEKNAEEAARLSADVAALEESAERDKESRASAHAAHATTKMRLGLLKAGIMGAGGGGTRRRRRRRRSARAAVVREQGADHGRHPGEYGTVHEQPRGRVRRRVRRVERRRLLAVSFCYFLVDDASSECDKTYLSATACTRHACTYCNFD